MMFVLAACSHDNIGVEPNPEEGAVLVNFSVQVPEMQVATRSFTDPKITSLHLLVFDENGYFVQAAEATGTFGVEKDTEYEFTAQLMQSPYKRVVHFIANLPKAVNEYGSETALINALTTSDSQDAYWQRVELPNGILEGNEEMATKFTEVPLVRNFVKISVDNQAAIFNYEGIAVINVPDMGTVAPFNVNNGTYATYSAGIPYKTLNDAGYYGYEPSDMKIVNTDTSNPKFATEHYIYIYERRQNQDDKDYTYVIIKGKYNNSETSTYYKVDIVDDNKEPYNLLRNFNYVIKINSVLGPGYESADAAAKAAASNNISASIDTKNLLNISDGSSRLYVEYVNKVITKPGTFTLKYKYLPNISDNTQTNNYNVPANDAVDLSKVVKGDVIASYSKASSDDASGWRTITFTTPATITETKLQTITIKAGVLQREINLILCKPFVLNVTSTPSGSAALNADATVTLGLPAGLPAAIFPLEFVIVETGLSISPDASENNLPVRTSLNVNGQTVSGGQYFGFVKKVEYSDYNPTNSDTPAAKDIVCYFKLNKAITSGLNVNVYNEYFE